MVNSGSNSNSNSNSNSIIELDKVANKVLEAGKDIEADHPGFLDEGKSISDFLVSP